VEDVLNEVPLLDPAFLLASHELEPGADVQYLGREALQMRAVPRQGKEAARDPFFWGGADDYELLVDKERGVLLRYAARLRGQDIAVAAVERVVFDAPILDDVFVFTPPPDITIELAAS
jgi:outer membrane lipoprotein-sorting protein